MLVGDRVELSKGDERTEDDGAEYSNNSIYVPLTETQVAAMGCTYILCCMIIKYRG